MVFTSIMSKDCNVNIQSLERCSLFITCPRSRKEYSAPDEEQVLRVVAEKGGEGWIWVSLGSGGSWRSQILGELTGVSLLIPNL